jgi:colanic acid/amylovoran biosynthesis glycosyltransferase
MRIAYLINHYPKISHTFIRREIHALERLGFEVMRIALRGWDGDLVDPQDRAERERTRYVLNNGPSALLLAVARMLLARPRHFARALATAWRMSRRAERSLFFHLAYLAEACRIEPWLCAARIHHLHAHFGTNSAEVAMLAHILGGPTWSFTVHGPEEFDKAPLIGLAKKIHACSFVVAVCSYGRSQLYRLVGYQHWSKIQVVHCGLELSFFTPSNKIETTTRRFVCVGRLCEQKAQLLLVQAAKHLSDRHSDFELVLAGDGELRGEIQALITRYKLTDKVHITGWISNEQVRNEILAGRALVLPSFAEGLPVVIMEAMALRRPVIATYIGGIPELIRPGEHGWLVPAGDVEALVEAMHACLETSANLLSRMGTAAYERVLQSHDASVEAARLGKLFQNVLKPTIPRIIEQKADVYLS